MCHFSQNLNQKRPLIRLPQIPKTKIIIESARIKNQNRIYGVAKPLIFILVVSLLYCQSICSQNFVENIQIPPNTGIYNNGGSMAYDIHWSESNGNYYVYSTDKLLVYSSNLGLIGTVSLESDLNNPKGYGKFNPVFFSERLRTNDIEMMSENTTVADGLLYVVTPELKLKLVDLSNNSVYQTMEIRIHPTNEEYLSSRFTSLNGFVIIKYDLSKERLYIIATGRSPDT